MFGEYKDNREGKKGNFLSESVVVIVENAFVGASQEWKNEKKTTVDHDSARSGDWKKLQKNAAKSRIRVTGVVQW